MQYKSESKLTGKKASAILESIRKGLSDSDAAKLAGIHPTTLARWLVQGESDYEAGATRRGYRNLFVEYQKAQAVAEDSLLSAIQDAIDGNLTATKTIEHQVLNSSGDWEPQKRTVTTEKLKSDTKAAQWVLERRFPKKYGQQQQIQLGLFDDSTFDPFTTAAEAYEVQIENKSD